MLPGSHSRENMEDAAKQIETPTTTEAEMFRSAILRAGYRNIGLKKVGSTKEIWLNKEAIDLRDSCKPDRHLKPTEFEEADTRVKTLMTEKEEESRRNKNATAMWNMVRNIQNSPRASSKGKVLLHNGNLCKTDREKANAFASFYKSVSTLKLRKEDRWTKRETNDFLRTNAADEESFKIE